MLAQWRLLLSAYLVAVVLSGPCWGGDSGLSYHARHQHLGGVELAPSMPACRQDDQAPIQALNLLFRQISAPETVIPAELAFNALYPAVYMIHQVQQSIPGPTLVRIRYMFWRSLSWTVLDQMKGRQMRLTEILLQLSMEFVWDQEPPQITVFLNYLLSLNPNSIHWPLILQLVPYCGEIQTGFGDVMRYWYYCMKQRMVPELMSNYVLATMEAIADDLRSINVDSNGVPIQDDPTLPAIYERLSQKFCVLRGLKESKQASLSLVEVLMYGMVMQSEPEIVSAPDFIAWASLDLTLFEYCELYFQLLGSYEYDVNGDGTDLRIALRDTLQHWQQAIPNQLGSAELTMGQLLLRYDITTTTERQYEPTTAVLPPSIDPTWGAGTSASDGFAFSAAGLHYAHAEIPAPVQIDDHTVMSTMVVVKKEEPAWVDTSRMQQQHQAAAMVADCASRTSTPGQDDAADPNMNERVSMTERDAALQHFNLIIWMTEQGAAPLIQQQQQAASYHDMAQQRVAAPRQFSLIAQQDIRHALASMDVINQDDIALPNATATQQEMALQAILRSSYMASNPEPQQEFDWDDLAPTTGQLLPYADQAESVGDNVPATGFNTQQLTHGPAFWNRPF